MRNSQRKTLTRDIPILLDTLRQDQLSSFALYHKASTKRRNPRWFQAEHFHKGTHSYFHSHNQHRLKSYSRIQMKDLRKCNNRMVPSTPRPCCIFCACSRHCSPALFYRRKSDCPYCLESYTECHLLTDRDPRDAWLYLWYMYHWKHKGTRWMQ